MLNTKSFAHAAALFAVTLPCWGAGPSRRVNLVEFGRVVELPDEPAQPTSEADELSRGVEGWEAIRARNGVYTIGVEWDEPRELAEVNIEFRHAIANREKIRAEYWKQEGQGETESTADRRLEGRWVTPKTEWWAGDRDVSFAFLPEDEDTANRGEPGTPTRRTTRLRFICGKDDLPPVRYLRAYGPERARTDTFNFQLDPSAGLAPPVSVEIVNGFILAADGRTTMTSAVLRETQDAALQIRYGRTDAESLNRARLILHPVDDPEARTVVYPAEVARLGQIRLAEAGVIIKRQGGRVGDVREGVATRPVPR